MVKQHFSVSDLDRVDGREWGKTWAMRICPSCGDTKPKDKAHATFHYNRDHGGYECKRCGVHGTLVDFWSDIRACPGCGTKRRYGVSKPNELRLEVSDSGAWRCELCGESGQLRNYTGANVIVRRRDVKRTIERQQCARSVEVVSAFTNGVDVSADDSPWREIWTDALPVDWGLGYEYLEGRGIGYDVARAADVRFHEAWGRSDKWAGMPAVLFPIHDRKGNLVAVSGRKAGNSSGFSHMTCGQKIEGVFAAFPNIWQAETIAVCEAPIDALAVVTLFNVPALAWVGGNWPAWLPMAMMFKRVLIATDNDQAVSNGNKGDEMAAKFAAECEPYTRRIERLKPDGVKDWAEVAKQRMYNVTPAGWESPF